MGDPSLTERLAAHLRRPVAESNRDRARLHLLDWLGCVVGARRSDVARVIGGAPDEPLAVRAAFLGNVLEMDDVHRAALLHPGPVIWPTVLGGSDAPMPDALDAAIRGYEAMITVGATFDARHYAFYHNTSTAGVFGAAAAAASLLGCSEGETVSALGLAGSVTGGLWQMRHEPVMAKQWHVAHAVAAGRDAARCAKRGVAGPRFILEGPQGLYAATTEAPRALVLGESWRLDEVSFKPWAACRHAHPAIDAALELRARGPLQGRIQVETYADALTFCDRPHPRSEAEAKFSIQHSVAVAALRGAPRPEDFSPENIADPQIAAVRHQVTLIEAAEFSDRYPAHFGARVSVGGDSVALIDTRGDPERPLAREDVIAKALQLFAWGGLDDAAAEQGVDLALAGGGGAGDLLRWLEQCL
jgi:2-methylcitrate dehydratase PrpD